VTLVISVLYDYVPSKFVGSVRPSQLEGASDYSSKIKHTVLHAVLSGSSSVCARPESGPSWSKIEMIDYIEPTCPSPTIYFPNGGIQLEEG
jgi:hypothetical protein